MQKPSVGRISGEHGVHVLAHVLEYVRRPIDRMHGYALALTSETLLPPDAALLMLGSLEQRRTFGELFEKQKAQK